MPLVGKDRKIMSNMVSEYGKERGKKIFYASATAGKLGKDVQRRHGAQYRKGKIGK